MSEAVQSVQRAADILKVVGAKAGRGVRLADVVAATSLQKSTALRLLSALVKTGLLDQDEDSRAYYLGFETVALGETAANRFGLADMAMEGIDRLVAATDDTVYLSARHGDYFVCIARAIGGYPIKTVTLDIGDRRPLGAGAGSLAILAFLPDEEKASVVAANAGVADRLPSIQPKALLRELEDIRARGYARTDGRVVPGLSALAVPVVGLGGVAVAALSVQAVSSRLDEPRASEILVKLNAEAQALSRKLEHGNGQLSPRTLRRMSTPSLRLAG